MTDSAQQAPARLAELHNVNVSQLAVEAIRMAIVSRALPPGSTVTESGLASQLNVSKTPVREALISLRQVGLIEPDGRRGDRVVRPSRTKVQNAYDVREALEVFTARLAAERAGPEQRLRIREAAERSLRGAHAGDSELFRSGDADFHAAITGVSGNAQLEKAMDDVFTLIVTLRQRDAPDREVSVRCGEDHVAIAAAIEAADPEQAGALIRGHIRYISDNVLSTMDNDGAFASERTADERRPG